jgi:DNA repair protein RadC
VTKRNMYLRIKDYEQDMLREAHRKINNKLLENGYPTVQDSEILHQLIEIGLKKLDVDNLGRFHIKN